MDLDFFLQSFEKYSDIKFNEYLSIQTRVVLCEKTDRHDEVSSRFSNIFRKQLKTPRIGVRGEI
jgi:hypothetical protein